MIESYQPVISILIPILAIFIIPFLEEQKTNILTAIATFLSFLVILSMYPYIQADKIIGIGFNTDLLIHLSFRVDSLGYLVGLISSFIWAMSSIYAIGYLGHSHALKRYNIFSLLSYIGMIGVTFTGNLFSLYIFFELLSVASYVMVIHEETEEAKSAGLVYLFMGVSGGLVLLFSMIATYSITGTGDLSKLGMGLQASPYAPLIFFGFILGFGVKAGLFPVHIWLPMAHPVAPAPGSALLSGVMIKAGAYGILRTIYVILGMDFMLGKWFLYVLLGLAAINIFLGSAVAMKQTEIKRMLAYSSIAQIGYIILGAVLLSPLGVMGSSLHIFNHAFIKSTLFLCAGAIIHQTGLRQMEDFDGIGKRMPITMICFTIASLSMIGFPPLNGFITKWHLLLGALEAAKMGSHTFHLGISAIILLLVSSFMNLMYYGPIIYSAWFKLPKNFPESPSGQSHKKAEEKSPIDNLGAGEMAINPGIDNLHGEKIHDIAHYSSVRNYFASGGSKDIHKDKAHGGTGEKSNDHKEEKTNTHDDNKHEEAHNTHDTNAGYDDPGHGHGAEEKPIETCDPPLTMLVPLIILAAGVVFFGVVPLFPVTLAQKVSIMFFAK